jgi:transcriptional regulator GlxA family with amidase domain
MPNSDRPRRVGVVLFDRFELVEDRQFLTGLSGWARTAELVTSVCTGSGVLAAAGLLDGYRARWDPFAATHGLA